jgi:hypothetical protein
MTEQLFWHSIRRLLLSAAKLIEMRFGKEAAQNGQKKSAIASDR